MRDRVTSITNFLKSRGMFIRNTFFAYIIQQATLFAQRNYVYALFATNKEKNIYSMDIFRAPIVSTYIVKI